MNDSYERRLNCKLATTPKIYYDAKCKWDGNFCYRFCNSIHTDMCSLKLLNTPPPPPPCLPFISTDKCKNKQVTSLVESFATDHFEDYLNSPNPQRILPFLLHFLWIVDIRRIEQIDRGHPQTNGHNNAVTSNMLHLVPTNETLFFLFNLMEEYPSFKIKIEKWECGKQPRTTDLFCTKSPRANYYYANKRFILQWAIRIKHISNNLYSSHLLI